MTSEVNESAEMLNDWTKAVHEHLSENKVLFVGSAGRLMLVPRQAIPSPVVQEPKFAQVSKVLVNLEMRKKVIEAWENLGMHCEFIMFKHGNSAFFPLCAQFDQRYDLCVNLPMCVASNDMYTAVGKRQAMLTMVVSAKKN